MNCDRRQRLLTSLGILGCTVFVIANADYNYPRLGCQVDNVNDIPGADLAIYQCLATGTATSVLQAKADSFPTWAADCLFVLRFGAFSRPRENRYPEDYPTWWATNAPDNPSAALDLELWRADSAEVSWWLLDEDDDLIAPYGGSKYALDLGPDCPEFEGYTFAEWLNGPWRSSFSDSFRAIYDVWQIDDAYCLAPSVCDSVKTGGTTYSAADYRDHAWPHFKDEIIDGLFPYLIGKGLVLRLNHHYDETACTQWGSGIRKEFADSMIARARAVNYEGCPEGPGPCPQNDPSAWLGILWRSLQADFEDSLSAVQTKITAAMAQDEIDRRQRFGLALASMYDLIWKCTVLDDFSAITDLVAEATHQIGSPVGGATWHGEVGLRRFILGADTTTVICDVPNREGTWYYQEAPVPSIYPECQSGTIITRSE